MNELSKCTNKVEKEWMEGFYWGEEGNSTGYRMDSTTYLWALKRCIL